MIGTIEIMLIAGIIALLYFFGDKTVLKWAKALGKLKKQYHESANEKD